MLLGRGWNGGLTDVESEGVTWWSLTTFATNLKQHTNSSSSHITAPDSISIVDTSGRMVIILATESKVAGSNPARVDGFFQNVKMLSMTSFGREVKPWVPCCRFTACKRTSSRN